jgi:hypothetical protein
MLKTPGSRPGAYPDVHKAIGRGWPSDCADVNIERGTRNMTKVEEILEKGNYGKEDIVTHLLAGEDDSGAIFRKAREIKKEFVGNKVYFRGLIEYSNYCAKTASIAASVPGTRGMPDMK